MLASSVWLAPRSSRASSTVTTGSSVAAMSTYATRVRASQARTRARSMGGL
jgi:hypothetical protein